MYKVHVVYMQYCSVLQFISNIFILWLWEHPAVLRILSEGNAVPQAISQLFPILHSWILEVIYKPRDRALSMSKAARLRLASLNTDKALSLGL